MNNLTKDLLQSGQIHKKVSKYITTELLIQDGIKLYDLATQIENKIKEFCNFDRNNPLKGGVAFPTGLSVNNCAAHWTPNPKDTYQTLKHDDLIKIDYGVHINGYITDGAFSFSFNDRYDRLIKASEEATATGIKLSGPEAYLGDIGKEIQEVIESYEIEIDGKTLQLNSIGDLSGHQIGQYKIHCGKPVPNILYQPLIGNSMYRMKEGEVYAIETFPTTGSGKVIMDSNYINCSHYMANYSVSNKYNQKIINQSPYTSKLDKRFRTLAFCKRWMKEEGNLDTKKFKKAISKGVYKSHPPLYSEPGTYVAQREHTIYISPKGAIPLN